MKWLTMLAFVALPAWSDGFRSQAPITSVGKESLQRVVVPVEVYRVARRDLADVRIVNGKGEEVPMAWANEAAAVKNIATTIPLPIFPVTRSQRADAAISVRVDGGLVSIKSRDAKADTVAPSAYVLDASQATGPFSALVLDWSAAPGTQMLNVALEASDDLKTWTALGSAPVVKLEAEGRTLVQPRVEFAPRKAKYLRLTWTGGALKLAGATGELDALLRPVVRSANVAMGLASAQPGEYTFDLGAALPVEALRLVMNDANSVVAATIAARDDPQGTWNPVTGGTFYRLTREGVESTAPLVEIPRRASRYWRAKVAAGSAPAKVPSLEVQWRPAQIVFVASGEGPFTMRFGDAKAASVALPVASLIPGYTQLAELKLPEAQVGAVTSAPPPTAWEGFVARVNAKTLALWAVLFAAVAFLGFMAWRMTRAKT